MTYFKQSNKWSANIRIGGQSTYLGRYEKESDAAEAYRQAINQLGESLVDDVKCD